jgi:sulfur carrier protein ThiS
MKVRMRNPDHEVEVAGDRTVASVLAELAVVPDTVLVIRSGELVTREDRVGEHDELEIRPVISGGAHP